jgi:hypothetical protein
MHDIERFLQNPVWDIGVKLHQTYGSNGGLKFLFALGETRDSFEKLQAEMQRLWEDIPFAERKSTKEPEAAPEVPKSIMAFRKEDDELFEEAKAKFERLKASSISKEERHSLAKSIKAIFRRKADIYNMLLEYEETGLILSERPKFNVSQATDADLIKRQKNLKSYFAPSKEGKVARLDEKKAELQAINDEIAYRNI